MMPFQMATGNADSLASHMMIPVAVATAMATAQGFARRVPGVCVTQSCVGARGRGALARGMSCRGASGRLGIRSSEMGARGTVAGAFGGRLGGLGRTGALWVWEWLCPQSYEEPCIGKREKLGDFGLGKWLIPQGYGVP